MPHAMPPTPQAQALRVTEEVAKLVSLLAAVDPQLHLTTAADLRDTCDGLLAAALIDGMTRARDEGWGLRPIAAASHYSHEQVRTLLAAASPKASPTAPASPLCPTEPALPATTTP